MDKFSINDWLTIQTRKDLTLLRRNLEHTSVNYAILADVFISVLSFCLDHVLWNGTDANAPSWYWIIIAILLAVVPVIILIYNKCKSTQYFEDSKKVMPIETLIDLFDNEVCYNVMTADSMKDRMISRSEHDEITRFYFIETTYYLNKAITQLYNFKIHGKKGIKTDDNIEGISAIRFENVCIIIKNAYDELVTFSKEHNEYKMVLSECNEYIENFNDLITHLSNHVNQLKGIKKNSIIT